MSISEEEVARILPVKMAVEGKLIKLPGITGVDIAHKVVGGQETDIPCILVFVAKKGEFAQENEIPPFIECVPTDVEEAVFTHCASAPAVNSARYDPCQGGACVAAARVDDYYGTLGMLVTDLWANAPAWLGNYHIFCQDPTWSNPGVDTNITQPALAFGGTEADNTIGQVYKGIYGQVVVPWGFDLYVDAALCTVTGRATSPNVLGNGAPTRTANASLNSLVTKCGAKTLSTTGLVVSTNFTANMAGTAFYYQTRVGPPFKGGAPFAAHGDSGSVVFDSNSSVIGIVAGVGGSATMVNPIRQIMAALNISVP